MIIGKTGQFAFEVLSDDLSGDLADVNIIVAGQQVSGRGSVYLPTFVQSLKYLRKTHASLPRVEFDFSSLSDEEAFRLLHEILTTDHAVENLTESFVFSYHLMANLDDAVDDWEIYVFDVGDEKRIVCREHRGPVNVGDNTRDDTGRIWKAHLPREKFIKIIDDFVSLFGNGEPEETKVPSTKSR